MNLLADRSKDLAVDATRPATWASLSFLEARAAPLDATVSRFCFFSCLNPAYPLVARERSDILPCS